MKRPPFPALVFVLIMFASPLLGAERFPRPELPPDHVQPVTSRPMPPGPFYGWIDTAVLVVTLALAAHLALRRRSRAAIFAVMLFSLVYFGFYRKGCICPIGAIQRVAESLGTGSAVSVFALLFFGVPLIFALFFGRVFCSSVCPLGAIQDVVLLRPLKVPAWLEHGLRLFAYAYLGLAVLFAVTGAGYVICRYDPFVSFFRLSGGMQMFLLGISFLVTCLFVGRAYCRFLCPLGVLLGLASRVSRWRTTITPDECIKCRLCEDACPFGSIRKPTAEPTGANRTEGKLRLGLLVLALPLVIATGAVLGHAAGDVLARAHPTVLRAREVRAAGAGTPGDEALRTQAFLKTGRTLEQLRADEQNVLAEFGVGTAILGGFLGLVVGGRLVALSVRRTRTDYEADRGRCVACGRCFAHCPREHVRRQKLRGEPILIKDQAGKT